MRLVIWLSFLFFALFAAAQIGVQTFTIPLATTLLDLSNADAAGAVTAYMLGMMVGITIAGQMVDRLPRHEIIALVALACSALVLMFVMVPGSNVYRLYALLAIAGALFGMIYPSRDMMVRRIAPAHATGRVFGFVYAGLDSGASITPALFGFLVDRGDAALIYPLVAIFIFLAIAIALFNRSQGHSRRASDA